MNKDGRRRFFEKNFPLADDKPDIVLKMFFLTISNINVDFQVQDLQCRSYIIKNILPITKKIELIGKKEFAATTFDLKYKAFIVHIATVNIDSGDEVYPSKRAWIVYLKADEAFTEISSKYANFADVFSPKLTVELPKHTSINNHAIKLRDD